jgi:hypothetical protein
VYASRSAIAQHMRIEILVSLTEQATTPSFRSERAAHLTCWLRLRANVMTATEASPETNAVA